MKIASVRSFLLSYPFPAPLHLPYFGGLRTILKRDAMLIRVECANGLVGYAPGEASETAHGIIHTVIAPFLEGRVLSDPDALRVLFVDGPGRDATIERVYCSVELALYDLAGKSKRVPVSELIGGRVRDRIRLYGSAGMYMAPQEYALEARAICDLGFRAYKMRAGIGPGKDLETVRLMRDAVGPDLDLMIDAHTWWRMGDRNYGQATVEELADRFAEYRISWLEEPLPPDDHQGYRRLRELDFVPIATGEHEPDEEHFADLIAMGGVDYVQMDIVCQGGYPMARRLFPKIGKAGIKFAFHSWGTALEVIAAAHLGICWPELLVEWLEYPCYSSPGCAGMYPFPPAAEILKDPLEIKHGDLLVPKGPGWGVDVNEAVIEKYPWIPGPWSYFEIESPREVKAVTSDHSAPWQSEQGQGGQGSR